MKFIRLATIAALSTTILAGGATAAFAEEAREVTTDGQVEFRAGGEEDGELEVVPPENEPDVEIEPEKPGTTGPLSILKAATMDFGTQVISNQDKTYNMVAEMQPLRETGELVPYVSFAQVHDIRGTNAGWDLQVSLSEFTSNTQNNVLTGAEIEFVDSHIQYEGINEDNAPAAHSAGLTLLPNGAARSVMTATEGKGALVSSVVWGDQEELNARLADEDIDVVENDAIQLSIPGSTAKDATTYTSTLTWELTSTPGENGPEETPETGEGV
ncbi:MULTISPECIES: WxL domain-containing protein [unclassified Enterococcus]|uniref:WxL domain-containing protein n=1 Tax=unclassified Enterococcus TaxID=2608891 RepID=UPI001908E68D|nr:MULTISPECIES: WxL domain-containing protein [unclassified Enterococcus]MBK0039221.1 WxL domain-containing protein [Enterococcus sp. S52]MBK0071869.1 WxL domain-containing protein [Enterococcus sp. S53]MBK0142461.1 WxL domain-containing protein [Enterococcus sp. S76]MBK0146156.1 WxL domain-containing protein [Enterococcus sp. S77]